jgi:hypothetical protein
MQKWEYKVVRDFADEKEMLNELEIDGDEGWELVSVTMTGIYPTLYFKRPVEVAIDKYGV